MMVMVVVVEVLLMAGDANDGDGGGTVVFCFRWDNCALALGRKKSVIRKKHRFSAGSLISITRGR